jgi:glucosamine kinase
VVGGRRVTVGGWGAEIGDEGSGMAIGRSAIRRAIWADDGMAPRTPLAEEILAGFDGRPAQAVIFADAANPGDYARFAPTVFDHAERRDPLAMAILHEAALDVERHITRLLDLGAPAIAMIGGIFPKILPWLAPPLRPHLVAVVPGETDALEGAILMARRRLAAPAAA